MIHLIPWITLGWTAQVTGSLDGTMRVWKVAARQAIATLTSNAGHVRALQFHDFALCR